MSDPRIRRTLLVFCPKASLVPTLNTTPLVSQSNFKTPTDVYSHIPTHPYPLQYPLQPGHLKLWGTRMKQNKYFSKRRPTGQIHGSNPRIDRNGLADCGDPTCDRSVSPWSIGTWRIGSGPVRRCLKYDGSGGIGSRDLKISQVGSGLEAFDSHGSGRVGSGQVRRLPNFRGSCRVS